MTSPGKVPKWFYKILSQEFGPVTSAELRAKAAAGEIRPDTLVRRRVGGSWVALSEVRGLFQSLDSWPPVDDANFTKHRLRVQR